MFPGSPSASTVVTVAPSTATSGVKHDLRGSPSIRTVHAPQPPCWQPAFGLVIPSSSRSAFRSVSSGRVESSRSIPLTVSRIELLSLREISQRPGDESGQDLTPVIARSNGVVLGINVVEHLLTRIFGRRSTGKRLLDRGRAHRARPSTGDRDP